MAHVELSLTEAGAAPELTTSTALDRWLRPVAAAEDPCVLLDADGVVVAASPACADFFAVDPVDAVGRRLVSEVLMLIDFSGTATDLPEWEIDRVPPVLALTSGALARGLLRAVGPAATYTLDAVTTPLREGAAVVGSLTFFAPVSGYQAN
ncbi:hypothetical protein GCM10009682_05520 [Luedemannella flava]|uniref:PAS fold-4 domain-containing protein n=1 Tax=Luedemannella flava TaxID=349316 RepID=A0ABP4XKC6_9ACTN